MTLSKPNFFTYNTPSGPVTIATNGIALTHLVFGKHLFPGENKASELTNDAANQLQEYFAGKREVFDLALDPAGTDFQKQVWATLVTIPYGETRSYSEIARIIGNSQSYRAVGSACNKNPLHIVVPCHRVISAKGKPVGYAAGTRVKEFLLELEQNKTSSA